ncbi:2a protein [Sambucus virus S]|uniref:RNA-directed RNA polymerase 2a n=1 Tax=Sambucus virus S TaxID=2052851 RepID=A0A2D3FA98_9BROM|nr:2a protein [Sambucus virus S]ATU46943.1 2a protein [Sambucus virus S]
MEHIENYEVPSFQWMFSSAARSDYNLESSEVSQVDPLPSSSEQELVLDGSEASFVAAIKPLEKDGFYDPAFDSARWIEACEHAFCVSTTFKDRPLKPMPEMARIIYLDLDDSLVDESEIDDWRPEDTSDGYDPETSTWSPTELDREADRKAYEASAELALRVVEEKQDRQCQDVNNVQVIPDVPPYELTLGDRYMPIEESFQTIDSDYEITLNLNNPVERRVANVVDTFGGALDEKSISSPAFLERVSLNTVDAVGHSMLPTHAYFDDTYYQALEENADYSLDFNTLSLRQSDVDWYRDPDKYYQPKLTVGSFQKRIGTQKTVLTALKKRNADVPEMGDAINVRRVARDVAEKFFKAFLNNDGRDLLNESINVMAKGLEYHKKWKDHRELAGVTYAGEHNLQRYQHMIKTDIKPVVTDTLHLERAVAATITFHGKGVTSCFSPYFTACFEKFSLALKSRFIVPIGKISSLEIPETRINGKWCLEADLSKFDKSQGELHLEFQREILSSIGFPAHLSNWWADFHRESVLSDPHAKVAMPVSFQRRTGDAFTYFGNTIVTMAMMAYTFDMNLPSLAIFSGDDSLLLCDEKPVIDAEIFSSLFNMEVKIMDPSVPYVCSKFLLETELGSVVSVPDPMREIQRMAKKKILKDTDALKAHFTSFADRMKFLKVLDEKMITVLSRYVVLKYQKPQLESDVRTALACFAYYSENFLRFSELYYTEGKHVYQLKDPVLHFNGESEDHRLKDGDWFHNWNNKSFPGVKDKICRVFGKYSSDYDESRRKEKAYMHDRGRLVRKSLLLAYDRRKFIELKRRLLEH